MDNLSLLQLFERNAEISDLKARLKAAELALEIAEKSIAALVKQCQRRGVEAEAIRLGDCLFAIPDTFMACGEAGNYCSSSCMLHAKLKRVTLEAGEWAKAYEELKNAICKDG